MLPKPPSATQPVSLRRRSAMLLSEASSQGREPRSAGQEDIPGDNCDIRTARRHSEAPISPPSSWDDRMPRGARSPPAGSPKTRQFRRQPGDMNARSRSYESSLGDLTSESSQTSSPSQTSPPPGRSCKVRRYSGWQSLLPSVASKEINVPKDDPKGRRTSVLAGGSMLISQQMGMKVHHVKENSNRERHRIRIARQRKAELDQLLMQATSG